MKRLFTVLILLSGTLAGNAQRTKIVTGNTSNYIFTPSNNFTGPRGAQARTNILGLIYPDDNGIVYVKQGGDDYGGDSWDDAVGELADALRIAKENTNIKQIWVAAGTYKPKYSPADNNFGTDQTRDNAFLLVKDVKLYGGFKGTETTLAARDRTANRTILSGDLNNDGKLSDHDAYHVIIGAGNAGTAALDGFIITGGNANGTDYITSNKTNIFRNEGGGISNADSSPLFNNITVSGNTANAGGGVHNRESYSTLMNMTIANNSGGNGGGINNYRSSSILTNVIIEGNTGEYGGGIFNSYSSHAVLTNVLITGNIAEFNGGGMSSQLSYPVLINVTISGNKAESSGGAIYNDPDQGARSAANVSAYSVGEGARTSSTATIKIRNSVIYGNSSGVNSDNFNVENSLIQGVDNTNNGNIAGNNNPLFVSAPVYTTAPFTGGDYRLLPCSQAINTGNNSWIPSGISTDLAGNTRIQLTTADMGAYEAAVNNFASIASADLSLIVAQNSTGSTIYTNDCNTLVTVVAGDGKSSAISGNTTARVWIEASQPAGFVKRHYEITPAGNAASATGTITLFFTQAEFNDYNNVNTKNLPIAPSDANGIANIRIEKLAGQSSNGDANATGLPNTYAGGSLTIDPDDDKILWNAAAERWEITFDVTGFSGFFVKASDSPLPVTLVSFEAIKQENIALLTWHTVSETNSERFDLQRSANGKNWETIGTRKAMHHSKSLKAYTFSDMATREGENLYRLKMIDLDESFTYSRIRSLTFEDGKKITAYPNPAKDLVTVNVSKRYVGTRVGLITIFGKVLSRITIKDETFTVDLSQYASGLYLLQTHDGKIAKIIKQ